MRCKAPWRLSRIGGWRSCRLRPPSPLPREEEEAVEKVEKDLKRTIGDRTREEIWNDVWTQAKTDQTYLIFVVLSTIVAALGPVRDNVAVGAMAIALASDAAAALSLVTGVSSALVGVMVAVALLPPTAANGLFLGAGEVSLAMGAFLLLAVNVVSVNRSAQTVLFWRGVRPQTVYEEKEVRIGRVVAGVFWVGALLTLAALMWWRVNV